MDELIDILDDQGNPTGRTALKSEAHLKGWFHPTVHIWCYTNSGNILIQQRAANKSTHPLLWDVSVAGHIAAGEAITTAAIREVSEEIGLEISSDALDKIGVFKSVHRHNSQLIDCEYHHTFLCKLKLPFSELKVQKEEVKAIELISLIAFAEETLGLGQPYKYVPHGSNYYKAVITAVKRRL